MRAIPDLHNLHDFSQRHRDTYGWYNGHLVYISEVTANEIVFDDVNCRQVTYTAKVDHAPVFTFLPVERGWVYSAIHGPMYMSRQPLKQYKRGISSQNTVFMNKHRQIVDVSHDLIASIFLCPEGLIDTSKEEILSKHFFVDWEIKTLYFNNLTVGVAGKPFLLLKHEILKQELGDIVRRKNLPYKVDVV